MQKKKKKMKKKFFLFEIIASESVGQIVPLKQIMLVIGSQFVNKQS